MWGGQGETGPRSPQRARAVCASFFKPFTAHAATKAPSPDPVPPEVGVLALDLWQSLRKSQIALSLFAGTLGLKVGSPKVGSVQRGTARSGGQWDPPVLKWGPSKLPQLTGKIRISPHVTKAQQIAV